MKKTYAAKGLIELQLTLSAGGASFKVCFTGGSMGTNGVLPAKYTTESPVIQNMIEQSQHFINKRIYIYESKD